MCHALFDPRRRLTDTLPASFYVHVPLEALLPRDERAPEAEEHEAEEPEAEEPEAEAVTRVATEPPGGQPVAASPSPTARRAPRIDWVSGPVPVVPGRRPRPRVGDAADRGPLPPQAMGEAELAAAEGDYADWHLASELELERAAAGPRSRLPALSSLGWGAGIVLLSLFFALQIAHAQRDSLAASEQWRPWVERLCVVAGCELPLQRDRDRLRLLRGQVTEHPREDDALVAAAVIVNEAPFPQPYPLVRLALLDGNQRVTAERWFHPGDYLEDPELRGRWEAGMTPGRMINVRVELRDPGSGAEQYRFEYR